MSSDRPHVICHMTGSLDGRIKVRRWKRSEADNHYETVHAKLGGDAWMCGRVTMQGYADSAKPLAKAPADDGTPVPRVDHVGASATKTFAIALDARGTLDWGARNEIEGDHVVVALTESVADAQLRALRAGGQSYVFAGAQQIDFPLLMRKLRKLFGIERLLLEGGGKINGSMLQVGVVDEVSLLLAPVIDGVGGPAVFDIAGGDDDTLATRSALTLQSSEVLDGGTIWLRYTVAPRTG